MKKLLVMIMSLALTLGVAIMPASAETKTESTHTFKAYQLFTGNMRTDESGVIYISSAKWGDGVDGTALLAALQADKLDFGVAFKDAKTAADVVKALGNFSDNSAQAKAFAKIAYSKRKTDEGIAVTPGTTELDAGYYVLVDTTTTDGTIKNPLILKLMNDGIVNIEDKFDTPTIDKGVDDGTGNLVKAITAGSWETLDFTITGTTPTNMSDYSAYKMVFTDTMVGMNYVTDSVVVKVEGGEGAVDASLYTANWNASKKELTVTIADALQLGIDGGKKVYVSYKAKLDGTSYTYVNTNTAKLTYSSNPNVTDEYITTPDEVVKVYSFKLTVNKEDPEKKALEGAGFTLYRKSGTDASTGDPVYTKVEEIAAATGRTTFEFASLAKGQYKLVETTVPDGYAKMADLVFTIDATIGENSVTALTVTPNNIATTDKDTGAITMTVVNDTGNTMPATGGMGTVLFYALGAMLVCGGIVMLMLKKRNAK